ncbi:retrovirus-related Pol polyprotein from transposon 17.6 [Trichonephila clavipes]|nr:retrovirus-related Pol polyprotein from transposon 17.6 [Trichonephila clavipes]
MEPNSQEHVAPHYQRGRKKWAYAYTVFTMGLSGSSKRNYWYTTFSTNVWKRSERTVVYTEVNLDWEHVVTSEYEGISRELFEKAKRKRIQSRVRVQTVGVIYDIDDEFGEIYETPTVPAAEKNDEALDRVTLDYLSKKQQTELKDLLHRHRTLFSGKIKS